MQKINLDKQTVIFSLLIVVVGVELLALLPWSVSRIVSFNKKISLLVQQIKTTQNDWPRLNQYSETKDKLKDEIENSQAKFIFSHQASKSLSFISAASKDFGVEIKSFLPGELKTYLNQDGQELFYLPIDIKAKARFHDLASFLDYLQNSQYFFDVKQLNIKSDYHYNSVEMVICAIVEKE